MEIDVIFIVSNLQLRITGKIISPERSGSSMEMILLKPVQLLNSIALFIFLDINECSTLKAGCSQICMNEPGKFHCSCQSGYKLQANNKTCIGKKYPIDTFLKYGFNLIVSMYRLPEFWDDSSKSSVR